MKPIILGGEAPIAMRKTRRLAIRPMGVVLLVCGIAVAVGLLVGRSINVHSVLAPFSNVFWGLLAFGFAGYVAGVVAERRLATVGPGRAHAPRAIAFLRCIQGTGLGLLAGAPMGGVSLLVVGRVGGLGVGLIAGLIVWGLCVVLGALWSVSSYVRETS